METFVQKILFKLDTGQFNDEEAKILKTIFSSEKNTQNITDITNLITDYEKTKNMGNLVKIVEIIHRMIATELSGKSDVNLLPFLDFTINFILEIYFPLLSENEKQSIDELVNSLFNIIGISKISIKDIDDETEYVENKCFEIYIIGPIIKSIYSLFE